MSSKKDSIEQYGVLKVMDQLSRDALRHEIVADRIPRHDRCQHEYDSLCLGTIFWGIGSDIIGRRISFNVTLLIAGTSGIAVGVSSSWLSVCLFYLIVGFGIGGNLPVVSALFLEILPHESGRYLTLLSIWWPIGQLVASFSAWCFMGDNRFPKNGWRYSCCVLGALTCLMLLGRFTFFHLFESPKYLLSRGRQAEAVVVVHGIAYRNKTKTWLTEDILNEFGGLSEPNQRQSLPVRDIIHRKLSNYSMKRFTRLFASRSIAKNTTLLWFCWFAIGLGYPLFNDFLPQYLSSVQNSSGQQLRIYRNYIIITIVSIPGSILACYTVDVQGIGRKGTMAVSTLMAGILLMVFVISPLHLVQVGISAVQGFFQNAMYAVLFTYTPESFPAPIRCTGSGISGFLNRIGGLAAVIIAANLPASSSPTGVIIDARLPAIVSAGVKFYSAPPRGGAWEPFLSLEKSQAERQPSYPSGSPFILAGLSRLRLYITNFYPPSPSLRSIPTTVSGSQSEGLCTSKYTNPNENKLVAQVVRCWLDFLGVTGWIPVWLVGGGLRLLVEKERTKNSGPRDFSFQSILVANGVYPGRYRFPKTGDLIPSPGNLEEMREIAPRRRPSLSKEKFTEADFEAFKTVLDISLIRADTSDITDRPKMG
ncbi:hypothetical protein EPUL_000735 [Erysiphe pulchra]|uniref:Major facilitator superfamily (MFS) profile domain-containing protein n=1 Tax=Erysiphe pulchra TaxID=225359 RepID=A0A2S4Q204_9PEZI|nr:hypothetical protein EPUL_000735 [Erysiphe pulchra]